MAESMWKPDHDTPIRAFWTCYSKRMALKWSPIKCYKSLGNSFYQSMIVWILEQEHSWDYTMAASLVCSLIVLRIKDFCRLLKFFHFNFAEPYFLSCCFVHTFVMFGPPSYTELKLRLDRPSSEPGFPVSVLLPGLFPTIIVSLCFAGWLNRRFCLPGPCCLLCAALPFCHKDFNPRLVLFLGWGFVLFVQLF